MLSAAAAFPPEAQKNTERRGERSLERLDGFGNSVKRRIRTEPRHPVRHQVN
jgi:hypothetical protein